MEKGMKGTVLVITERYFPERFLINDLVQELAARGHSLRVLTQVPSYPEDRLYPGYPNTLSRSQEGPVQVTRFKTVLGYRRSLIRKILNYAAFMARACLLALRESRDADAVFVYHTGPLTQALPLALIKPFKKKRTVIWTQDVWPDTVFAYGFPDTGAFAVLLKAFVRFIYRFTDVVLVSSPGFVGRLAPYLGKRNSARFVPQWVPDAFQKGDAVQVTLPGQGAKFVFTGNLGTMQNLENLIRAFARVSPETATLFLLGDGTARARLEALVDELHVQNVCFLGSVEQSRVKAYIQACDFSVLSLTGDRQVSLTVPAKFQTYLAAGRPIFAVASGEVRALVDKENLGPSADPDDVDGISRQIERAAHSTASERADWARNATTLLGQYDKKAIVEGIEKALFATNRNIAL